MILSIFSWAYWSFVFHLLRNSYSNLLANFFLFRAAPVAYGSSQVGVELELQLLAYATATAMPEQSLVCNLHLSSWQCWILNPLSGARDQTLIFMDTSCVCYCWAMTGTPLFFLRATPADYGRSQASGWIRAAAAGLQYSHRTPDPSPVCNLCCSSQQRWILNPLNGEEIKPTCSWILVGFLTC